MTKFNFEKLTVHEKSINFTNKVYHLTKNFPKEEIFGLSSQLRRAAVSIPLNIAEGSARTKKDFGRFIDISRGSVRECSTVLRIALEQGYIDHQTFSEAQEKLIELSKMLSSLKRSLSFSSPNSELRTDH